MLARTLAAPLVLAAAACALRAPSYRRASPRLVAASPTGTSTDLDTLTFLTPDLARRVAAAHGTPTYVYDGRSLARQARTALEFPNAYGLTVRFAMKSLPNRAVLRLFRSLGVHIDASSGYECRRAIAAGYAPEELSLSSQELPKDVAELVKLGVVVNACSLAQLKAFGEACPGARIGLRFNPGLGSGSTGKTNVGGPSSSFGIWHESLPEALQLVERYGLHAHKVHTHIGSGSDPAVWQRVAGLSLELCRQIPTVETLNLGGGFKVARTRTEVSTDLAKVGAPVRDAFEAFAQEHGRKLKLEIEPGTFLVANAGSLLCRVQDMTSTRGPAAGAEGHDFVKLDAGMTDILRPSLYGSQHPIVVVPADPARDATAPESAPYIVAGHCCESGDLLTCAPGEPETLLDRPLQRPEIGDLVFIEGAGAYCSGMSAKNYNSFPEAAEVLVDGAGEPHLVRKRQTLEQIYQNEQDPEGAFAQP